MTISRRLKVRGRQDSGLWRYGYLVVGDENLSHKHYILSHGVDGVRYEVDPATVGQYTGLDDARGVDIYEGDIITGFDGELTGQVGWSRGDGAFVYRRSNGAGAILCEDYAENFTVIGNIYEKIDGNLSEKLKQL